MKIYKKRMAEIDEEKAMVINKLAKKEANRKVIYDLLRKTGLRRVYLYFRKGKEENSNIKNNKFKYE